MSRLKDRYKKNSPLLMPAEQKQLAACSVCVVGCGGLGGGVIENLTRLGLGRITVVDCDSFDESNLNRQVLSNENNLGHSKAIEARLQMKEINSEIDLVSIQAFFSEENSRDIVRGHNLVIDALDNIPGRMILEDACEAEGIPLIHGAIDGWQGQIAVVMPGERLLHRIYNIEREGPEAYNKDRKADECQEGSPSFTPAVVAGVETAEALKLLIGKEGGLSGELLLMDLLANEYEIVEI